MFRQFECRIVKDVICFHASDFDRVADILHLDLYAAPMEQVICRSNKFS